MKLFQGTHELRFLHPVFQTLALEGPSRSHIRALAALSRLGITFLNQREEV